MEVSGQLHAPATSHLFFLIPVITLLPLYIFFFFFFFLIPVTDRGSL
jgi:hypothetical protein